MKCNRVFSLLLALLLMLIMAVPSYADTQSVHHDQPYDAIQAEAKKNFQAELPKGEDVGAHWFDDAAFVGDSVSIYLSQYGKGEEALGDATFLVAGSYSTANAMAPVSGKSLHPAYQGTKMKTEDAIALSGANKVYIMLGMNDIGMGLDKAVERYVAFIRTILEKSPNAQIYLQSVTPMVKGSTISGKSLNNANICEYNERMKNICQENGWYYLDVASVLRDEEGYLKSEYCNDNPTMGIHIYPGAIPLWVEYLRTHTPQKSGPSPS